MFVQDNIKTGESSSSILATGFEIHQPLQGPLSERQAMATQMELREV